MTGSDQGRHGPPAGATPDLPLPVGTRPHACPPGRDPGAPLLDIRDLSVAYGAIRAVHDVSLQVAKGEVVALLGANGAGKTTTLRAIAGLLRPVGGSIRFDGADVANQRPHRLVRRGLVLVPEGRGILTRLTVLENLLLGATARPDRREVLADLQRAYARFPRLAERHSQNAGTLSGGEQQMLAIARALMSRPRLLMLDEPSLGLAPLVVREIFTVIAELKAAGVTVLLVEQNARAALEIADRAYVLETGQVTLAGPAAELRGEQIVRAYLGERAKPQEGARTPSPRGREDGNS